VSGRADGAPPLPRPPLTRRLINWAARFEDGELLRAAFFGMLIATVAVLAIDYLELGDRAAAAGAASPVPQAPVLPAVEPGGGDKPGPAVTTDLRLLTQALAITLVAGGRLELTGTIDQGAADRVAAELAQRGEYVRTVVLDSPGGALEAALANGRLIRDRGLATAVAAGSLCASSCPLVFAAGKERTASPRAAIGVHQFYLIDAPGSGLSGSAAGAGAVGEAMETTQKTTAAVSRYLAGMGVDPGLWLYALDTPPDRMHYFSVEELIALKLVTNLKE
jgi:hypothetical protein